ncbi:gp185 [Bacillus phage W.Ph.]|uniref:Gp185 n=1 Tax=Bacillus phage W.Ph. TaxID=764595 RepID=G9B1T6_9CAUD|nr:gp185 [Bacillus phage W.Ph.]ADH03331.1 gp185 [Bacillus phage W.Ph.]
MANVYGKTEFSGELYAINEEETMIYKLESFNQMSMSKDFGLSVDMELVAGYDYVSPDYNNRMGWVSKEGFVDDSHNETFTFYPMVETLKEALEEAGFKPLSTIEGIKVHPFGGAE